MYPLAQPAHAYAETARQHGGFLHRANVPAAPAATSAYDELDEFIRTERPYLRQGYTLIHMSKDLGIPRHILSRMINQRYGKNFNALINEFRIAYLKEIPKREPNWHLYTMEALGKLAGFNSRNTLIKAFRKCTGESPSGYFMRVGRHGFSFVLGSAERLN